MITGIMTLRNAYDVGYPFVPAIRSVLPITDEFLINDGGSNDGTREKLAELEESFDQIKIYDMPDYQSKFWDCIDDQLDKLIDDAEGDWLIEAQADEIWPLETLKIVESLMEPTSDFNSIRQPRVYWPQEEYRHWTVRCVKNVSHLRSFEGGDSFHVGTHRPPTDGYTCHNVGPELELDEPFLHLRDTINGEEHKKRHAKWLATKSKRAERYD